MWATADTKHSPPLCHSTYTSTSAALLLLGSSASLAAVLEMCESPSYCHIQPQSTTATPCTQRTSANQSLNNTKERVESRNMQTAGVSFAAIVTQQSKYTSVCRQHEHAKRHRHAPRLSEAGNCRFTVNKYILLAAQPFSTTDRPTVPYQCIDRNNPLQLQPTGPFNCNCTNSSYHLRTQSNRSVTRAARENFQ